MTDLDLAWNDLPATAHRLVSDALASGHQVKWSGSLLKNRAYLNVTITTIDHDGAEELFSGNWRYVDGKWRYWYGDMDGEPLTLTALRSFVVEPDLIASR